MYLTHHHAVRLLLLTWAAALAFGLGVERSRAATAYPSCEQICSTSCILHDGCEDYFPEGGTCYYWCLDGCGGEAQMGK